MSLFNVFDIAGSGMSAQSVRLNTVASNMANANSVSSSEGDTYRARSPVFQTVLDRSMNADPAAAGVRVAGVVESQAPLERHFQPEHPSADPEGYIYRPNVNVVEEMANMISASRSYQTQVEVLNTSKQLVLRTLTLGQ